MGVLRYAFLLAALCWSTVFSDGASKSTCRAIPGDESWPTEKVWSDFNETVGGRLIRTVPIATVCHGEAYEKEKCDVLRDNWHFPETHLPSSSSPMAYEASNDSCNPFSEPTGPCVIGNHVAYTVNATSVHDFEATIHFCKTHNVRLVIRNTGHDYLGKSTGAHAVALWTRHLKSIELLENFNSAGYRGPAIRVGAGVDGGQAQQFAHEHGLMVVVGNCPTVGIAGGWVQGGAHSPLSSFLGLGADSVLAFEVVTSAGDLLTTSPTENSDLFWALTGGGGSTYAIVYSMTIKAYREVPTSTALLTVPLPPGSLPAMQSVLSTFLSDLPTMTAAGVFLVFALVPNAFLITPAYAPNLTSSQLTSLLTPTLTALNSHSLAHSFSTHDHPNFHTAFLSIPAQWNVSNMLPAGRLIPRSLLIPTMLPALTTSLTTISSKTGMAIGVAYDASPFLPPHGISANPLLRTSAFNLVTGMPLNYSQGPTEWAAAEDYLVHEVMGPVRQLAPKGGAYLSEASLREPHWEREFFGGNHERLLEVKDRWDPEGVFWVAGGVGSGRWQLGDGGRLCRVDNGGGKGEGQGEEEAQVRMGRGHEEL
jgi:hypothetical protein